jgi:hypothetical protein
MQSGLRSALRETSYLLSRRSEACQGDCSTAERILIVEAISENEQQEGFSTGEGACVLGGVVVWLCGLGRAGQPRPRSGADTPSHQHPTGIPSALLTPFWDHYS